MYFIYIYKCVCANSNLLIYPSPLPFPFGNHKLFSYVSVLQTSSFILFFKFPIEVISYNISLSLSDFT